ncbi:Uncharacterised protein [Vibrio cholerae]|nr:Uncharacterised protein [Vibrio cholerae]
MYFALQLRILSIFYRQGLELRFTLIKFRL